MNAFPWLLAAGLTLIGQGAAALASPARPPDILVVLADDLGFNDTRPFGQTVIQTPTLSALAREGMRFTNFHVHATCSPTRAQLLTGVDNHRAGMGAMGEYHTPAMDQLPGSYIGALNDRVTTFAEVLKRRGYATFMAGKWHLGGKESQLPPARGFDRSFVLLGGGASHWNDQGLLGIAPKARFAEDGKPVARDTGQFSSDLYTDKLLSYLKEAQAAKKPSSGTSRSRRCTIRCTRRPNSPPGTRASSRAATTPRARNCSPTCGVSGRARAWALRRPCSSLGLNCRPTNA